MFTEACFLASIPRKEGVLFVNRIADGEMVKNRRNTIGAAGSQVLMLIILCCMLCSHWIVVLGELYLLYHG